MVEERLHHVPPEPRRGIALELDVADVAPRASAAAVIPRSHHEVDVLALRIFRSKRAIQRRTTVDIFLVEQSRNDQHWDLERLFRQQLVHRLVLPELVVRRMLREVAPEPGLLEAARRRHRARRTGAQILNVSVTRSRPPLFGARARGFLSVDVVERRILPERSVVEPVIAHPAIDHRRERHRNLQGRMRMHHRHHHRVSLIRAADRSHAAVGFGNVLHQPVDGVVGVGDVVGFGRVQRAPHGPRHHILTL